jgi:HPt (histidine-containing phosphotransfer) domain-containing protein
MQIPLEVKRTYLRRRIGEIDALRGQLKFNDFAPVMRLGHQIKGNAPTFEFPQFASLGLELERAARCQDREEVLRLLSHMEGLLHSVARELV